MAFSGSTGSTSSHCPEDRVRSRPSPRPFYDRQVSHTHVHLKIIPPHNLRLRANRILCVFIATSRDTLKGNVLGECVKKN